VPIASLNREIMDVAFVSSVDHEHYPGGYQQQVRDHRFDDAAVLSDHWKHKYLLDLDGMGYSGKFLAFLGSDSAVIKSTVYQEFFSDWIQPWYVLVLCISFLISQLCVQASLYPTVDVIYRDIQHPCLLLRWYARCACYCELYSARRATNTAHTHRRR
jgi:Glycosyl transferase family 90